MVPVQSCISASSSSRKGVAPQRVGRLAIHNRINGPDPNPMVASMSTDLMMGVRSTDSVDEGICPCANWSTWHHAGINPDSNKDLNTGWRTSVASN